MVSLAVFAGTQMRHQSASVYLIFLNLVDIVFLLCLMVLWLAWIDVHLIHINGWCQITIYLTYVSSFLSVWAVVSFSVERFIVVFFPLRRQTWCTRERAIKATIALLIISILLYSFSLWTSGIDVAQGGSGSICRWLPAYNHIMTVMIPTDSIITFVIPSTAIVILNISITARIWEFVLSRRGRPSVCMDSGTYAPGQTSNHSRILHSSWQKFSRWRRGTTFTESTSQNHTESMGCCKISNAGHMLSSSGRQGAQQLRTTHTLLILSTVFIILHTPSHAFRFYIIIHQLHSTSIQTTRAMKLFQSITQILYYANFASNFFLYCTFSQQFRNALTGPLWRWKKNIQRGLQHIIRCPTKDTGTCL